MVGKPYNSYILLWNEFGESCQFMQGYRFPVISWILLKYLGHPANFVFLKEISWKSDFMHLSFFDF